MHHSFFMQKAIELAEIGRYKTAPNPCVGAVLVYKNIIIAQGWHEAYGMPHAEVACFIDALEKGIFYTQIKNGTLHFSNPLLQEKILQCKDIQYKETVYVEQCVLYVTLEPCNHYGKTPPCSHAIKEAGIKTVYIGCSDPNPKAAGGAIFLKDHGITVYTGCSEKKCRDLIADFLIWQQKRPYCIVKMACSLDGKIGPSIGHGHKISGSESQKVTMQMRRNMVVANGAVMVGGNTFFEDNPKLTIRNLDTPSQPLAFIISKKLPDIKNGKTGFYCLDERKNTVIFTTYHNEKERNDFKDIGISLEIIDKNIDNTLNLKKIFDIAYQKYHCPYIFCEGGAKLAQALLKDNLADMLILYIAPTILGDDTAKNVFSGNTVQTMQEAYHLRIIKFEKAGEDLHIYLKMENACLLD